MCLKFDQLRTRAILFLFRTNSLGVELDQRQDEEGQSNCNWGCGMEHKLVHGWHVLACPVDPVAKFLQLLCSEDDIHAKQQRAIVGIVSNANALETNEK